MSAIKQTAVIQLFFTMQGAVVAGAIQLLPELAIRQSLSTASISHPRGVSPLRWATSIFCTTLR